ncbi:MAG TPA: hypothetical protein VH349_02740 [Ktedonobacterales bacterium]|jgi:hypothetical protein
MSEWSAPDNQTTSTSFDATLLREQQALRGFVRGLTGDADQARDSAAALFAVAILDGRIVVRGARLLMEPFSPRLHS